MRREPRGAGAGAVRLLPEGAGNEIDNDEEIQHEPASIEIDSVSTMDEIELDIGNDLDGEDFSEDADFDNDDEDEEDEDDALDRGNEEQ